MRAILWTVLIVAVFSAALPPSIAGQGLFCVLIAAWCFAVKTLLA
jgi:hypothetical protein